MNNFCLGFKVLELICHSIAIDIDLGVAIGSMKDSSPPLKDSSLPLVAGATAARSCCRQGVLVVMMLKHDDDSDSDSEQ